MASSTTQSPPIRNAQMDTSGAASIAKSVNLFRGDVNLTQSLVSLPGPSDAMSVSIAIQYQSNVALKALQDNVQAPTSVIGLGWSLPLTYIERSRDLSPNPSTRRYTFYDNGSANPLVRQSWMPTLFSISNAQSSGLVDGQPVPSNIQNQFLANGLALSSTTVATYQASSNRWVFDDDKLQQEYTLLVSDDQSTLEVHDGGEIYQSTNYNFEKILYYPTYERWVIVGVHGVRKSFGGRTADNTNGYAQSVGNSIRWEVWKRSSYGQPLGFCTVANEGAANQIQVAAAWYCCQIQDRYGNAITCAYNAWQPNSDSNIVEQSEQLLGAGGLPYTTAMYIGKIVDATGHTITFDYKPKSWSNDIREYVDSHNNPATVPDDGTTPRSGPSNYQTPYETFSLYAIKVKHTDASQNMFDIKFGHDVENLTNYTGDLKRDTYKRLLKYIEQTSNGGPKLPRIKFTYDQTPQDPLHPSKSQQVGALLTQQTAQGALTTYTYEQESYDVLERTVEIDQPSQLDAPSPRVYFGPDFSATLFTNPASSGISLQIDSWEGRWIPWSPDSLLDTSTVRIETIEVMAAQDFLAISFLDGNWQFKVYAFQRTPNQPGQWQFASVYDPATNKTQVIAANQPLKYPCQAALYGGANFFSVLQTYEADWSLAGYADTFTYDWVRGQLVSHRIELSGFAWAAAGENYLGLLTTDGKFQLHTVDEMSQWSSHGPKDVELHVLDAARLTMSGGSHIIAISQLISTGVETSFTPSIVEWDAGYDIKVYPFGSPSTRTANEQTLPWTPVVVEDTLVGICGHVFRATASGWEHRADLVPGDDTKITQSYSYGADFAIGLSTPDGENIYTVNVLSYDASMDASENWSLCKQPLSSDDQNTLDRTPNPQVLINGSDWLVIGPFVYFRGSANNWGDVLQKPAAYVITDENFISSSLINLGPDFITYGTGAGEQRELFILRLLNGEVLDHTGYAADRLADNPSYGMGGPGNQMFVSFSSNYASFDSATSVTIYRFAAGNVTGPIHHYPVTQVTVDDGINDPFVSTIQRNPDTVGCDASGSVVQYYKSSVYPGSQSASANGFGWIERKYYNGHDNGADYYSQLDGMLISTSIFDQSAVGQPTPVAVYSKSLAYDVYTKVATSPTSGSIQLRGSVAFPTQTTILSNDVTTVTTTSYENPNGLPFNGQKLTQKRSQTAQGTAETYTRTYSYVQQVGEQASIAIGAIADVVQVVDTRSTSAGTIVLQAQATTRIGFKSGMPVDKGNVITPAPDAKWMAYGTADTFDFGAYRTNQNPPTGWNTTQRLTGRTSTGQYLTAQDPMETNYFQLWDDSEQLMMASFVNAEPEQCAYIGFQSYKEHSGWTSTPKQVYDNLVAYSGVQSGRFNTSSSITSPTVSTVDGKMMVGIRSLIQNGDGTPPNGTPQVEVSYTPPGGGVTVTSKDIESNDDWQYTLLTIDTEAGGSLTVTFRNDTNMVTWLDMIVIAPFKSAITLTTYDPTTHVLLTTQDASGRASRSTITAWGANGFTMTPDSQPQSISVAGLVQPTISDKKLNLNYPSCTVTLQSTDGGSIETFRDQAGEWQSRWHVSSGHWGRNDGSIVNSSNSGSLVYRRPPAGDSTALYVEPDLSSSQTFEIVLGGNSIQWDGTTYSSPNGWTPLLNPSNYAQQWLAVLHHGHMFFFADGQLIFSEACESPNQTISITTGHASVTLRNLAVASGIRMSATYADANGNTIQAHQLMDGDSLMSGRVFDQLGRQIATTRVVKGSQVSSKLMAFNPDLIDACSFVKGTQMLNDETWAMSGDVANIYPTDDDYPYYGMRFERSVRSKRKEVGCPGNDHGIGLTNSSSTQIDLGATDINDCVTEGDRSISVYRAKDTDVQVHGEAVRDHMNRLVGAEWEDADGTTLAKYGMVRSYDDTNGPETSAELNLPQYYAANEETMLQSRTYNGAGNVIAMSDPDSGTTQFVYDSMNRLRFTIPNVSGNEQAFILYTKFDRLGRELEQGRLDGSYTRETLQSHADDLTWPSSGQQVTVLSTFDGDGSDAKAVGLLTTATTTTIAEDGSSCVVQETYTYTSNGLPETVEQTVSGIADHKAQIGYSYNRLGEVTKITLPDGAGVSKLFYSYDGLGRTSTIGSTSGGSEFASYTYTPDGAISTVQGSDFWTTQYAYDPKNPNLPATITGTHSKLTGDTVITSTYNIDSSMHSRDVSSSVAGITEISETFGYDDLRRLKTVTGSDGNSSTYTLDANGNITQVYDASGTTSLPLATGSNQIGMFTSPTVTGSTFVYDVRGQLIQDSARTYTYDESISRPITVQSLDQQTRVQFGYGSQRQRAVKVSSTSTPQSQATQIYLFGGMPQSWIVYRDGDWYVDINGPSGRLMTLVNGAAVVNMTDLTGSVWATFDSDGLQDTASYGPYGESNSDPNMIYRYQGREWDNELGLYNFAARLYDPATRRFTAPDPMRQLATPYAFASSNPLMLVDPTGEMSIWAEVLVGAALTAAFVAGAALTGGAADAGLAALIGADAAETGAEAGAASVAIDAGSDASVDVGVDSGIDSSADIAAEGGDASGAAVEGEEVDAGISASQAAWAALPNPIQATTGVTGAALMGGSLNTQQYLLFHPGSATWAGVGIHFGTGAASGVIGYGLSVAAAAGTAYAIVALVGEEGVSPLVSTGIKVATNVAISSGVNMTQKVVTNKILGNPLCDGLGKAALAGAVQGGIGEVAGDSAATQTDGKICGGKVAMVIFASENVNAISDALAMGAKNQAGAPPSGVGPAMIWQQP